MGLQATLEQTADTIREGIRHTFSAQSSAKLHQSVSDISHAFSSGDRTTVLFIFAFCMFALFMGVLAYLFLKPSGVANQNMSLFMKQQEELGRTITLALQKLENSDEAALLQFKRLEFDLSEIRDRLNSQEEKVEMLVAPLTSLKQAHSGQFSGKHFRREDEADSKNYQQDL